MNDTIKWNVYKALMAAMITLAAAGVLLLADGVLVAIGSDHCPPHPDPTTCIQLVSINGQWTCIPQDQAG